jgi:TonB family protein
MQKAVSRRAPEESELPSRLEDPAKPARRHHEIKPQYTPVQSSTLASTESRSSRLEPSESSERSQSRRLHEIESTLDGLASNVRSRGGQTISVELPGAGGGPAFAGYETAIFNAYFHAWTAPDDVAGHEADVDAKIVVARDGTILSSQIVSPSGHRQLDRSVEEALRLVTKLPPFPESARDAERTFLIRFNLEAKLSTG